jgi:hypothetical protein
MLYASAARVDAAQTENLPISVAHRTITAAAEGSAVLP